MAIQIPWKNVHSNHSLCFKTSQKVEGKDVYFISISGIAIINFKGIRNTWSREELLVNLRFPYEKIPTPSNDDRRSVPFFKLVDHTVFVSLNAIYNHKHAVNSGYAVDSFGLENPSTPIYDDITIKSNLAISDVDSYLYRVGCKVELLAYYDQHRVLVQ